MKCKICGSGQVSIIYDGIIRNGGLEQYTKEKVPMFQCSDCGTIWHENQFTDMDNYYESEEYRESLEGGSEEERFYELHDKETLDKLSYTGTDMFRKKVVADIGCGAGAFLDFVAGVAEKVVAVEPSEAYRKIMKKKGFSVYPYAEAALKEYREKIDVITSFDVIEHVENPQKFVEDICGLLSKGGKAVIGTPTDAPVMRKLVGGGYMRRRFCSAHSIYGYLLKKVFA